MYTHIYIHFYICISISIHIYIYAYMYMFITSRERLCSCSRYLKCISHPCPVQGAHSRSKMRFPRWDRWLWQPPPPVLAQPERPTPRGTPRLMEWRVDRSSKRRLDAPSCKNRWAGLSRRRQREGTSPRGQPTFYPSSAVPSSKRPLDAPSCKIRWAGLGRRRERGGTPPRGRPTFHPSPASLATRRSLSPPPAPPIPIWRAARLPRDCCAPKQSG